MYIAHELFDALPVHQFVRHPERGWLEKMVDETEESQSLILPGGGAMAARSGARADVAKAVSNIQASPLAQDAVDVLGSTAGTAARQATGGARDHSSSVFFSRVLGYQKHTLHPNIATEVC